MKLFSAIIKRVKKQFTGPWLEYFLNVYPPYLGAGVRVRELGPLGFESSMRLRFWNQNYYGTHFGGSLYAMCDPFFVLVLTRNLGSHYIVWDKSATIRFRRPGRGRVTARFEVTKEQIEQLRAEIDAKGKLEVPFQVKVRDEREEVVAEIDKVIHVRVASERPKERKTS
jgi:acyl-coenzyme A thioesterase PaaI-like protein